MCIRDRNCPSRLGALDPCYSIGRESKWSAPRDMACCICPILRPIRSIAIAGAIWMNPGRACFAPIDSYESTGPNDRCRVPRIAPGGTSSDAWGCGFRITRFHPAGLQRQYPMDRLGQFGNTEWFLQERLSPLQQFMPCDVVFRVSRCIETVSYTHLRAHETDS